MGNKQSYRVTKKDKPDKDLTPEKSRHAGSILGLATIDDKIITCSDDKNIAVSKWLRTGENPLQSTEISYLIGHTRAVNRVAAFNTIAGNPMCWTASRDLSIRCWDLRSNDSVRIIENSHSLNVSAIACGNHSEIVFSGSRDYTVKGWDTETGLCKTEFSCPRNIVTSLIIDRSTESSLFQGSEDLCVRVWDTRSNSKQPNMLINSFVYFPLSLDLDPRGNYLAAGTKGFDSVGCDVKIFDLRKVNQPIQELKGHTHDVVGVKYSRDGEYLISASKDGSVICWSCNSKHRNEKNNMEVSNDSNFTKVASITSTGKHFTDLSILPYKCDRTDLVGDISCDSKVNNNQNRSMNENYENKNFGKNVEIETILSASDGSLSYYSVKEKNQKIGDKKGIMKDGKSCVDDNREFKFVLLGSTAVYRTAEDIEI